MKALTKVKCPRCHSDNPADARFCNECGAGLAQACRKCGQANPGGSKYCNQCGASLLAEENEPGVDLSRPESYTPAYLAEKILTSRGAIEGEKKQVTVLFCDIANAELNLADIYTTLEEFGPARRHLDNIYRIASSGSTSRWTKWRYTLHLLASYAEFWLARGDPARAEPLARKCIQQAKKTASRKYWVKGLRLMGEICSARGDPAEAKGWLTKAVSSARSLGIPTQLYRSWYSMGRVHARPGESALAQQSFSAAPRVVEAVADRLTEADFGRRFDRLPIVERILDAGKER